jgi:VWFA-related protein
MTRAALSSVLFLAGATLLPCMAADDPVIFRSDVSLVRVDAQVLDRDNRAITGLKVEDFILTENGQRRQIRNFVSENMPVDVLFLLDVSASMRPHVQRIASAAHQALRVLGDKDRVAIMVFDRSTRVRLPFRNSKDDVEHEFDALLKHETFRGGTDITRGMMDAAEYIGRQGRADARRAIVILTDDQTEFERDDERVGRALDKADAVMSALIAPDAMGNMSRSQIPGMGRGPSHRGGIGMGGPLGGIILPGSGGGGRYPQQGPGQGGGSRTHTAGTSEIAEQSGGDSFHVDEASALETTLSRLRQRYALYFQLPEGARTGQQRNINISLADAAVQRYPSADVRYRRSYNSPATVQASDHESSNHESTEPATITRTRTPVRNTDPDQSATSSDKPELKRRPAVSGPGGGSGPIVIPNPNQP